MRILITNDDGVHGEGLGILEAIARELSDDVWVVAPETDQSGLSHSLSLSTPLRLRKVSDQHFAVSGTPGDCVIMAVRHLMDSPPDLVLSGVNAGQNVADDVTYSGTVAGAMEGTLLGIRSIAMSQAYRFEDQERKIPWETARTHGAGIVRAIVEYGFPQDILYNVNFPNRSPEDVIGRRVTVQGRREHGLHVDQRTDGRGHQYYWIAYRRINPEIGTGTDLEALRDGAISITPLGLDLTAHDLNGSLQEHLERKA